MKKVPDIIKIARRKLRDNQTKVESLVWHELRARRLGIKFQRQFPLYLYTEESGQNRYIIPDFYCSQKRLVLEIDGSIHTEENIYKLDRCKEDFLVNQGYKIIRISNEEVEKQHNLRNFLLTLLQPLALEKSEDSGESLGSVNLETKKFTMINESFSCENCKQEITKHPSGSARNHCPYCLYSKHLDKDFPGDRASECHGIMKPVGKDYHKNKGWIVIHECTKCSKKIPNKLAEDDSVEVFGIIS